MGVHFRFEGTMNRHRAIVSAGLAVLAGAWMVQAAGQSSQKTPLTGSAAFVDYRSLKPGTFRKITAADLPQPFATESSTNPPRVVARPADMWPQAAPGFKVDLYASG